MIPGGGLPTADDVEGPDAGYERQGAPGADQGVDYDSYRDSIAERRARCVTGVGQCGLSKRPAGSVEHRPVIASSADCGEI
jgi:hypothetical protein